MVCFPAYFSLLYLQDGGEGSVGVVENGESEPGWVRVQWSNGTVAQYRWGGDFDLIVIDPPREAADVAAAAAAAAAPRPAGAGAGAGGAADGGDDAAMAGAAGAAAAEAGAAALVAARDASRLSRGSCSSKSARASAPAQHADADEETRDGVDAHAAFDDDAAGGGADPEVRARRAFGDLGALERLLLAPQAAAADDDDGAYATPQPARATLEGLIGDFVAVLRDAPAAHGAGSGAAMKGERDSLLSNSAAPSCDTLSLLSSHNGCVAFILLPRAFTVLN